MHVVLVTLWYPHKKDPLYGIFVKDQAQKLAERCSVSVIVIRRSIFPKTKKYQDGKVNVIERQLPYLPNTSEKRLTSWSALALKAVKEIQEIRPIDVIHCHDYIALFAGMKIKEKFGIPYVATIHNTDFLRGRVAAWRRPYLKRAIQESHAIISVGKSLSESLSAYGSKEKIRTIFNGVNIELFAHGRPSNQVPFKFLFIGNYEDRKNVLLLLEAFSRIEADVRLTCIGYGELKEQMISLVKDKSMESRVDILDPIPNEALPKFYQSHHCYVSISTAETFGITVAEAMSCGMHVLYSESGGPEHFVSEIGSFLISLLDPKSVAERMQDVIKHYDPSLSHQIRTHAIETFSESTIIDEIIDLYKEIIER